MLRTPPKQPKPSHVSPSAYMQVLTLPDFFTDNDTTPALPITTRRPLLLSCAPSGTIAASGIGSGGGSGGDDDNGWRRLR